MFGAHLSYGLVMECGAGTGTAQAALASSKLMSLHVTVNHGSALSHLLGMWLSCYLLQVVQKG